MNIDEADVGIIGTTLSSTFALDSLFGFGGLAFLASEFSRICAWAAERAFFNSGT
jgi:hypothetical protein